MRRRRRGRTRSRARWVKPESAAALAQRADPVAPAGEDLVRIGLVPDVPDDAVMRRIEHVVQRDGEFDDAEPRAEVAAGDGHRRDRLLPEFVGNLPEARLPAGRASRAECKRYRGEAFRQTWRTPLQDAASGPPDPGRRQGCRQGVRQARALGRRHLPPQARNEIGQMGGEGQAEPERRLGPRRLDQRRPQSEDETGPGGEVRDDGEGRGSAGAPCRARGARRLQAASPPAPRPRSRPS